MLPYAFAYSARTWLTSHPAYASRLFGALMAFIYIRCAPPPPSPTRPAPCARDAGADRSSLLSSARPFLPATCWRCLRKAQPPRPNQILRSSHVAFRVSPQNVTPFFCPSAIWPALLTSTPATVLPSVRHCRHFGKLISRIEAPLLLNAAHLSAPYTSPLGFIAPEHGRRAHRYLPRCGARGIQPPLAAHPNMAPASRRGAHPCGAACWRVRGVHMSAVLLVGAG